MCCNSVLDPQGVGQPTIFNVMTMAIEPSPDGDQLLRSQRIYHRSVDFPLPIRWTSTRAVAQMDYVVVGPSYKVCLECRRMGDGSRARWTRDSSFPESRLSPSGRLNAPVIIYERSFHKIVRL